MERKGIIEIIRELKKYSFSKPVVQFKDPYKVLVAAMLSASTADANTRKAVEQVFKRYESISAIAMAKIAELEQLVKPAGFYRVKARNLKKLSKILLEKHAGRVPSSLRELKELPGLDKRRLNASGFMVLVRMHCLWMFMCTGFLIALDW